jgi:integrase
MPKRLGLPLDAWPAQDGAAWQRATTRIDYFDDEAPAGHWSAATLCQARCAYGRWLAFVRDRLPEVLALSPGERVNPDRARQYVQHIAPRVSDAGVSSELGHLIMALRAVASDLDWSWLRRWQYLYQQRAVPREKRNKILHPSRLIKLGRDLMDSADQQSRIDERARQFRDGLLIALLASRPIRRRALSELRVGSHLCREGEAFTLLLPGADTKSGHPVEMPLSGWLAPYLNRYLEHYRPLFRGAADEDRLWLSSKGSALGAEAIHALVRRRTEQGLGVAISPHLFRDIAATMIAREAPELLSVARDLLTHSSVETTLKHYTQANTLAAAREYQKVLDGA